MDRILAVASTIAKERPAAAAITAVLERGKAGEAYNAVDDEPVEFCDFLDGFAEVIGAKRPLRLPQRAARLAGGYASIFLTTQLVVSNEKLKSETGWRPRYPSYREGLAEVAGK